MLIKSSKLIEDFYNDVVKDKYDVSFEQCKEICLGPWRFVRDVMKSGTLEKVRLKYFGLFLVRPGRVKHIKEKTKQNLKEGSITIEEYNNYIDNIDKYEKRNKIK